MNNNRVIAIVIGAVVALFAFSLVMRFVLLSEYGLPLGWVFFGLPVGGIGVLLLLLRLGLLNNLLREKWGGTLASWPHNSGVQVPPPTFPLPAASASQRLHELETMRASSAISEMEYAAKRQQIISDM
ncbi:MAG: hypothetical protein JO082_11830 [Mycobacterium sp.]|nr:hypothetical protein [Mycobacterium sp.]MBV9722589.1 hypothetical protein [Mycobacterium sp.]